MKVCLQELAKTGGRRGPCALDPVGIPASEILLLNDKKTWQEGVNHDSGAWPVEQKPFCLIC